MPAETSWSVGRHENLSAMKFFAIAGTSLVALLPCAAGTKVIEGTTLDVAIAPGKNYDKAEFRLWFPAEAGLLRGTVVAVPGSGADGRPKADDAFWRVFAAKQRFALIACHFTDSPHDQAFIEYYVNASQGSGQALVDALTLLAGQAHHPELATAPLLLWGESAGGEFNYEFAAWRPERVIAFILNKGGIYYTALVPPAARAVPALLFVGGADLESRKAIIAGLFAVNRRAGALWAIVEEPGVGHACERSRDLSILFFEEVLPLRLGQSGAGLTPLVEKSGFWGNTKTKTYRPASRDGVPDPLSAWLPTERVARAWQAAVADRLIK